MERILSVNRRLADIGVHLSGAEEYFLTILTFARKDVVSPSLSFSKGKKSLARPVTGAEEVMRVNIRRCGQHPTGNVFALYSPLISSYCGAGAA